MPIAPFKPGLLTTTIQTEGKEYQKSNGLQFLKIRGCVFRICSGAIRNNHQVNAQPQSQKNFTFFSLQQKRHKFSVLPIFNVKKQCKQKEKPQEIIRCEKTFTAGKIL
jgi:hypothetical protein